MKTLAPLFALLSLALAPLPLLAQLVQYPAKPHSGAECTRVYLENGNILRSLPTERADLRWKDEDGHNRCIAAAEAFEKARKAASKSTVDAPQAGSAKVADRDRYTALDKATQLRDEVGDAKKFVQNPGAYVVQKSLDQVQGTSLDAAYGGPQSSGDAKVDFMHERNRELIDASGVSPVAQSVATESSKIVQREQRDLVIPLQGLDSQLESFATFGLNAGTKIMLRGTLDAPVAAYSSSASKVDDSVQYRPPARFVDPITNESFVIPEGFTLYRSQLGGNLAVVNSSGVGTNGDDPSTGVCSATGLGRVTTACEQKRRSQR
jgi:hypothetical protein